MSPHALARSLRRAIPLAGLAALLVVVVAGCGGESGCALAPGPCAGSFPTENIPQPTVEPAEITVAVGGTATFTVHPNGLLAPTYQWFRSGRNSPLAPLPGASGVTYSVVRAQTSDDGASFMAYVESADGNSRIVQFSTAGRLTVTALP